MYGFIVVLLGSVSAFLKGSSQYFSFDNIEQREIPGKGIGLVTLVERTKNDPLFTIDKQAVYFVERDFPLRKNIEKVFQIRAANKNEVALYFLEALSIVFYTYPDRNYIEQQIDSLKLDRSAYFPLSDFQLEYFESIPKDCANYFTYSSKTQELLKILFDEHELVGFEPVIEELMEIFRKRLKNLPRKKREFLSKVLDDEEKIKNAICLICSRGFASPEKESEYSKFPAVSKARMVRKQTRAIFIPIVDLINCCFTDDSQNDSGPKFEVTEDKIIFYLDKHFSKGDELCFKYAAANNLKYYLNYGFFDPTNRHDHFSIFTTYLPNEKNDTLVKALKIQATSNSSMLNTLNQAEQEKKVKLKFEIDNYQQAMNVYSQLTGKTDMETMLNVISVCSTEIERINVLIYSFQETYNYLKKQGLEGKLVEERLNAARVKLTQSRLFFYYLINTADDLLRVIGKEIYNLKE